MGDMFCWYYSSHQFLSCLLARSICVFFVNIKAFVKARIKLNSLFSFFSVFSFILVVSSIFHSHFCQLIHWMSHLHLLTCFFFAVRIFFNLSYNFLSIEWVDNAKTREHANAMPRHQTLCRVRTQVAWYYFETLRLVLLLCVWVHLQLHLTSFKCLRT